MTSHHLLQLHIHPDCRQYLQCPVVVRGLAQNLTVHDWYHLCETIVGPNHCNMRQGQMLMLAGGKLDQAGLECTG